MAGASPRGQLLMIFPNIFIPLRSWTISFTESPPPITHGRRSASEKVSCSFSKRKICSGESLKIGTALRCGAQKANDFPAARSKRSRSPGCWLKSPRILIMDEATSALDNASQAADSGSARIQVEGKVHYNLRRAPAFDTVREFDSNCSYDGVWQNSMINRDL